MEMSKKISDARRAWKFVTFVIFMEIVHGLLKRAFG